jgi:tetratricopeptide (TPR) repeat protein
MTDPKLLEKQAIQLALEHKWDEALKVNEEIIRNDPKNIPALNRLARAFWEKGEIEKAKKAYKKVLSLDEYNPIASKNIRRIIAGKKIKRPRLLHKKGLFSQLFLEEPGKTKVVKLVRLAASRILSGFDSTDPVDLVPKNRLISVQSGDIYLGTIPEDLSQRLLTLMKGGNRFEAVIKAIDRHNLEILIREIFRSPKFHKQQSFPPTSSDFTPFPASEEIHEEKIDLTPTGEEEETP